MDLGSRIKHEREKLNISQDELAAKMDMSRQAISKWETGKSYPDIEKLIKLSDIFNLSLDELVRGDKIFQQDLIKKSRTGASGLTILGYIFIALGIIVIIWGGEDAGDFLSFLTGGLFLALIGQALIRSIPRWLLLGTLYATGVAIIVYLFSLQMLVYALLSGIVITVGVIWWLTACILKK
jgi:transcriptional regulator with XRE-family HTH domain